MSRADLRAQATVLVYSGGDRSRLLNPSPPRRRLGPAQACVARETYLLWHMQVPRQRRRCSRNAVASIACSVAKASRDLRKAQATEAGQAGFAIFVGVTVAHAHVAFVSATPFPTVTTLPDRRELWHHAVVITTDSVARAARDRRIVVALEAGQA